MPTNKLWIEHTERAAWQSVQALREKLAEAERREARLAPPATGWRELFEQLDALRAGEKLTGETYAELLQGVLARLNAAESRVRELEQAGPPPVLTAAPAPVRRSRRELPAAWENEDDEDAPTRGERRLALEIKARYTEFVRDRSGFDAREVLADVQTRLEELPALDATELLETAADLGALALFASRGQREG
ncbi:MAG TPA: hypothetical protein VGK73_19050 [Polyangiaceae bacterium]